MKRKIKNLIMAVATFAIFLLVQEVFAQNGYVGREPVWTMDSSNMQFRYAVPAGTPVIDVQDSTLYYIEKEYPSTATLDQAIAAGDTRVVGGGVTDAALWKPWTNTNSIIKSNLSFPVPANFTGLDGIKAWNVHDGTVAPNELLTYSTVDCTFIALPMKGIRYFNDTIRTNIQDGTAVGQIAWWNGTEWSSTSGIFFDNPNRRFGINTTTPDRGLTIKHEPISFVSDATHKLISFTTLNPSHGVAMWLNHLEGNPISDDRDTWCFKDPYTLANWGLYYRNKYGSDGDLPSDAFGFIGNTTLRAYISLINGDAYFAGKMGIGTLGTKNKLDIEGSAVVGAGYAGTSTVAPNSLAVQSGLSINTISLSCFMLNVNGSAQVAGRISQIGTGLSVFLGESAGLNDDLTSNKNVFIGYFSGLTNTTGGENTAVGFSSMYKNTSGIRNVSAGYMALYANTSGGQNQAFGYYALHSNTTGSINSAFGVSALENNVSGVQNVAIGNQSAKNNSTGNYNVSVGAGSNNRNESGSYNVIIGDGAGYGSAAHSKSGNVFIGYNSGYNDTTDNKLYIENSNSTTPLIYGDFDKDSLVVNGQLTVTDVAHLRAAINRSVSSELATSQTLNDDYWMYVFAPTLSGQSATLPLSTSNEGREYVIVNASTTQSLTIARTGTDKIDGSASDGTLASGEYGTFVSTGTSSIGWITLTKR